MNRPNAMGDAAVLRTDYIESQSHLDSGHQPRRSSTRPSLCLLIGTVPALLAGSLIVGARIDTMLRVRSVSSAVAAGLVVLAVVVTSSGGRQPRRLLPPARPHAGELLSLGAVGVAALLVLRRMSGFSFFSPMVYSVDAAHHSAIVTWIVDHGAIPSGYVAQFATYEYPPWAHLCAAVFSEIAHVQPITGLWLTAIAAIAFQAPLMMAITRALSPDRGWGAATIPVLLSLVVWRFTLGMITWDFFFAQAFGLYLALAGVAIVVCAPRGISPRVWAPSSLVLAMASFLTYPQQAAIVPAAIVVRILVQRRTRPLRRGRVVAAAVPMILITAAGLRELARANRLSLRYLEGGSEGAITFPTMATLGGWLPTFLAIAGFCHLLGRSLRRDDRAAALAAACAVPTLLALSLWSLQHGFPIHVAIPNYRIVKNIYSVIPFASIAASCAVVWAAGRVPTRRLHRSVGPLAIATLLAVAARPVYRGGTSLPLVSRDSYALTRWASGHLDPSSVGLVGVGLEPYALWLSALARPIMGPIDWYLAGPNASKALYDLRSHRWDAWPADQTTERYLVVSGRPLVDRYVTRPNVLIVKRTKTAVLLERMRGPSTTSSSGPPTDATPLGTPEQGAPGLP